MGLRKRSGSYFKFLIYLVVVVLINVAGITLFARIDLTKNKIYSISEASREVLLTLSEPMTIKVFFTKNLPAPHNNTETYLRDLLAEYSVYGKKNFNYTFYDVSPEQGDISKEAKKNQEMAESYGIFPVRVQAIEKDEVKFQKAYMGMVMIHGDLIERVPSLTSTDRLEYRLTTAMQKLTSKISALLALPEKIKVKLFLSPSLEAVAPYMRVPQLVELPGVLEKIVASVNKKSYDKLEYQYIDFSKGENMEELALEYNLLKLKWPALAGGKVPEGKGAVGLVMEYKDKKETIQLIQVQRHPLIGTSYQLSDLNKMEELINEQVESLININEDLGWLSGHATLRILGRVPPGGMRREDTISNFPQFVDENYTLKKVNIKHEAIPDSLKCLVVAGPQETFTDYDLFQIDQFLMKGKSLALFVDLLKETKEGNQGGMGPVYVPFSTGLEKLLEHYGVHINPTYVMDKNCFKQRIPVQDGGGQRNVYFAPMIKNQLINKDLLFMQNTKGLVALKMSPLEVKTEQISKNGLQAHRLFSSSDQSWEVGNRVDLNPLLIFPPKSEDEMQSIPLAYILEGEFPSYFTDKPIPVKESPEKDDKKKEQPGGDENKPEKAETDEVEIDVDLARIEGEGEVLTKGKPGKILLIASSEMIKDNMVNLEGTNANAIFILNLLDYLNDHEEIAVMRGKGQSFNPLDDSGARAKLFVKYFNIAGLPALVIMFGLGVWFRRHTRKKRIQTMFQQ